MEPNKQSLPLCRENDNLWPEPDKVGKQELEIVMGDEHISFVVRIASSSKYYSILIVADLTGLHLCIL